MELHQLNTSTSCGFRDATAKRLGEHHKRALVDNQYIIKHKTLKTGDVLSLRTGLEDRL